MDQDYPDISQNTYPEESAYPDIDENVHYPWQESQQPVSGEIHASASVLDPRLFGDSFSQNLPQAASAYDQFDEELQPDPDHMDIGDYGWDLDSDDESDSDDNEDDDDDNDDDDEEDFENEYYEDEDDEVDEEDSNRPRPAGRRGPWKAKDPGPEFRLIHSQATEAFIDGNYELAQERTMDAIHVNPEMFPAHLLLSEIFLAQGQKDKALGALFSGAHTRPRDRNVWLQIADLILQRAGEDRQPALNDVVYCYSRVLDIAPKKEIDVRYARAAIYMEQGYIGKAAQEYERILRARPHNTKALCLLAEALIQTREFSKAINYWSESVEHFISLDPIDAPEFSWSEINIYVELFGYVEQYEQGLVALKTLARWLLGRKEDYFWEDFTDDDREWDLQHSPRRIKTDGFIPGQWPDDSYGLGLPLELRIKMGIFRLRMGEHYYADALDHFEWLNPEDNAEGARLFDFGDLFREVADALKSTGSLHDALRFYSPIQLTSDHADVGYFMAMADCLVQLEKMEEAESCYLTVVGYDPQHLDSRVLLAKLYEKQGMNDHAVRYANEALNIGRLENRSQKRRKDTRLEQLAIEFRQAQEPDALRPLAPKPVIVNQWPASTSRRGRGQIEEAQRIIDIQFLHAKLLHLELGVKDGVYEAIEDWLDIADALLRDFRSNRVFYPMSKGMEFQGYYPKLGKTKTRNMVTEAREVMERIQKSINQSLPGPSHASLTLLPTKGLENEDEEPMETIPNEYRSIPFDEWLDIFLQYALLSTDQGDHMEAYEVLNSAAACNVWHHNKAKSRLIHICWFTCALRIKDEETLSHEARWFIKEYQFVTDTYRLFAMLSRLCGDPHKSLFHSSPNMKFMLRQIKAMDFTLTDTKKPEMIRHSIWKERASLTTKDENGQPIPAYGLDAALLTLYGHILYSGGSFFPALNYFFRAYALDDQNPAVLLSIGLCYIHHSLKRQSENRHYLILQGLSFMKRYRVVRSKPGTILQERQEMEFNCARVWHGLGLAHHAIEGYEKVLELGKQIKEQTQTSLAPDGDVVMGEAGKDSPKFVENFAMEAAYGLQCLHVMGGEVQAAKSVTEEWLVI
ncbi:hypothetical protein N7495_005039 [Penicillium taxi]|uniref:uncharacterized protein n=1 Tax=Penicillium taxi TaxID=168475 RepID=UPI0025459B08|nr:uncharacterized protein N7495_005039 [Penicillium taxi]KAJ5893348.1 hypothetical protein N7495_005039 [Penicillium taxi]